MKVITNTDIIENRTKWAKRVAPLTMLFLIGGLVTNILSINQPEYFQYTLVLLALGFIFASISSYLVNRWVREPRADQFLTSTLKKFGNDYTLFNYTSPTSHVLLTPSRLYAILVKNQNGQISVDGRRFHRKFSWSRLLRFFADEGLGSPVAEVENGVDRLYKLLKQHLPDGEIPESQPLIIFSNKQVDLKVSSPVVPVVQSGELKTYLREQTKERAIAAEQRNKLIEIIGGEWEETKQ